MTFDRETRLALFRANAVDYSRNALGNITREYPSMGYVIASGPGTIPTHREAHPAFYGSFDWHSCVEMHWVLVSLLRRNPSHELATQVRQTLGELLTTQNLRTETAFFEHPNHSGFERPYGWGWLLTLASELQGWDDEHGRTWSGAIRPLAGMITSGFIQWLPKQTWPIRSGMHNNTAFGLLRSLDYAESLSEKGEPALLEAIYDAAARWYLADTNYPAHYEPSGADFLSAALTEAEFMSRVVDPDVFPEWLEAFLPNLEASDPFVLFNPVVSSDHTDGQIAHLEGLNLSRAASFLAIAAALPEGDPRIDPMIDSAKRHADASLPAVTGGDYMTEHWLSAYATLLLTV